MGALDELVRRCEGLFRKRDGFGELACGNVLTIKGGNFTCEFSLCHEKVHRFV